MRERLAFVRPELRALFTGVDVVGGALARLVPRRPVPSAPSRILLVNLAHLGDVLLTTPAIASLRERHPDAHLTMLVGPWSRDVVEGNPRLDEIQEYRASWYDRAGGSSYLKPAEFFDLVRRMRAGRYDVVVNFKSFFQENLAAALAGIPTRIGYGLYGGGFLHTLQVRFPRDQHTAREHLLLVAQLGASPEPRPTEVHPGPEERAWAAATLASFPGEWIAMHPGAGVPARRWPLERFRALATTLHARRGARIAWVGGDDDRDRIAAIQRGLEAPSLALAGSGGIRRTAALIQRCAGFVGNDSGPAHVAAATGTPTLVIFSCTNLVEQWKPWGADVHVLQERPECTPSTDGVCARGDHACMTGITVDRVADQLIAMLDRAHSPGS